MIPMDYSRINSKVIANISKLSITWKDIEDGYKALEHQLEIIRSNCSHPSSDKNGCCNMCGEDIKPEVIQ